MKFIYNLLFPVVFLFFLPGLIYKLVRRPGYKQNFAERFGIFSKAKKQRLADARGAVWVHAVSVGETMVALSLIRQWRATNPERRFVLSTTTTTGQALAREHAPGDVVVIYCPLDFFLFVRKLLRLLRPAMLIIFETEIWPNMIYESVAADIPVTLVNARMSDHSSRGYYRFRRVFRPLLEKFAVICVQSEVDRHRFASVSPLANLWVFGNMKFDQHLPDNLIPLDLSGYFGEEKQPIMLAASTHPGEEELIAAAWLQLKNEFPDLRLIIVPRHAERGTEIMHILKKLNIPVRRRSNDPGKGGEPVSCLLADTTGEMLQFMQVADVVIMGKSLAGQNEGHNLIEPALLGKPIVTGSVLKNFRFIFNILKEQEALVVVEQDKQLKKALSDLFRDESCRQTLGKKAKQAINVHTGATEKTINLLEEML